MSGHQYEKENMGRQHGPYHKKTWHKGASALLRTYPFCYICILIFSLVATNKVTGEEISEVNPDASDTLSVVYCLDCTPFEFQDESGEPAGMIMDHWKLWSKKTGITVNYQPAPWNKTLEMMRKGNVDAHAGLFYSKERDQYLQYGSALRKTDTHLFYHQSIYITHNRDLIPFRVGVISGDYVEGFLHEKFPEMSVVGYSDYDALMDDLKNGQLQVFAADTLTGLYHLQKNGMAPEFHYKANTPLYQSNWFVAVPEGRAMNLAAIEKGMAQISSEEKQQISRHWITTSGGKDPNTLIIAIDRNYPPFSMLAPDGEPVGLLVEMWRKWSKTVNTPVKFMPVSRTETLEALQNGDADIHFGLFKNPERESWMTFSKPLHQIDTAIYFPAEARQPLPLEQLSGKRVAALARSCQQQYLLDNYPDIEVVSHPDGESMILDLLKGNIDALVHEVPVVEAELSHLRLKGALLRSKEALFSNSVHAAVLKKNKVLMEKIDAGFAAIPVEALSEIEARWRPKPVVYIHSLSKKELLRWILPISIAFLLVISCFIIWNRRMRREISEHKRTQLQLQKLSQAIEQSPYSVMITDRAGEIEYVNPRFSQVCGYSAEEVMGKTPRIIKSGRHSEAVYNALWDTILAGKIWTGDLINKKKNGQEFWEHLSIAPIMNKANEITNFVAAKEDITARKEEEERFQSLLEAAPDAILLVDSNGIIVVVNSQVQVLLGYSRKELLGNSVEMLVPEEMKTRHPDLRKQFMDRVSMESITRNSELNAVTKDGRRIPVDVALSPLKTDKGMLMVASVRDITERKRVEQRLYLTQYTMDNAVHSIFWVDPENGHFIYVNNATTKMLEYSRETLRGMHLQSVDVGYDSEAFSGFIDKLRSNAFVIMEKRYRSRSGQSLNVELTCYMAEFDDREIIIFFAMDVSHKREMEKTVQVSEAYFRAVFDNAGVGIASLNLHRQFTRANTTFLNFTGYNWDDLQELTLLDILITEHADQLELLTEKQIQGDIGKITQESRFVRRDGEKRWADIRIAPIRDDDDEFTAAVITVFDITDRKRAEVEQARRMRAEKAVVAISRALLNVGREAVDLEKILQQLVIAAQVDRVYVFENQFHQNQYISNNSQVSSPDTTAYEKTQTTHRERSQADLDHNDSYKEESDSTFAELKFEACAPGVSSLLHFSGATKRSYTEEFVRWKDELSQGNHLKGLVEEFPKIEQALLKKQNAVSMLILPLQVQGKWHGFIGFDDTYTRRFWSPTDESLLRTTAEIIGAYLAHSQPEGKTKILRESTENRIPESPTISSKGSITEIAKGISDDAVTALPPLPTDMVTATDLEKRDTDNLEVLQNQIPKGNHLQLEKLLERIAPHLRKKKPRFSKKVMTEIMTYKWPDEYADQIRELDTLVRKYNFKEALTIVDDMLTKVCNTLMTNRHV